MSVPVDDYDGQRLSEETQYARPGFRTVAEAINAGDLDGALSLWSPRRHRRRDGTETRGHAALSERFGQLIASGTHLKIETYTKRPAPPWEPLRRPG